MNKSLVCLLGAIFVFLGAETFARSVVRMDIRSKGNADGTTTHSNVVCTLQRDAGSRLNARLVLTGKLAAGWASVEVAKDGVLLYSGSIEGLKHDKPSERKTFEFVVHEGAVKNSKIIIGSFYDAVLTLPLDGVKISDKQAIAKPSKNGLRQ